MPVTNQYTQSEYDYERYRSGGFEFTMQDEISHIHHDYNHHDCDHAN